MVNWLAKASGAVSRETGELPQEFELTCECGQSHRGHRKSKSQRIICQTCGTALFILPRNVYPSLQPLKPKRKRRRKPAARTGEFPSLGSWTRKVGHGTSQGMQAVGRSMHSAGRSVGQRIAHRVAVWLGFVRAQLTPFRLVLAGISLMLVVTGLWAIRTRGLEQARETLRTEFAAGETALSAGDAAEAQTHFLAAANAAGLLKTNDARARQARQMLHETTAMTRLAPVSLLEMLEEAEQVVNGKHPELWEDRFRATYAGTWILLEAPIHLPTENGDRSTVVIDMPLVVGELDRGVRVTAEISEIAGLNLSTEPRQAIFAATLANCEFDTREQQWRVTLHSESGFLWSNADNLRSLGYFESDWVSEEETRELLQGQSKMLGIP